MSDGKRYMVHFPPEIVVQLDRAKQTEFYNDSKSEMLRQLILRGLQSKDRDNDKAPA